jgi:phenylpropionate dioxygenase-like ring-hydroxylating dioxygenase large terminal subunit
MLSQAQNDLVTQTDAGTPGGKLLRSYWQPIATDEEMPIGGAPMPIKIMGEELVLFRDDRDRLGLIGLHCAHRGTDLSYGRVENGGLRCLYHGWLFDIDGKCLDQPAEPEDKKFCHKVRQTSYPVQQKGGAIWCYMGDGEAPLIPDFQFLTAPADKRIVFRVVQDCNWLQGLESSTDPSHTSYLHRLSPGGVSGLPGSNSRFFSEDLSPRLAIEHVSFGVRIHALRKLSSGENYLRVNNYIYPCGTTPSGVEPPPAMGYQGRWYVPRDDHSHCRFEFIYQHNGALDKEHFRKIRAKEVGPDKRHVRRAANRYLQDRDEMKRDDTFAGMGRYAPGQDAFAIETAGSIQDRTEEHLGSTDIVIIEVRKALLNAIKQMDETGEAPGLLRDPRENQFPDFICTADYIREGEDGPAYCRRILSGDPGGPAHKAAAE